MKSRFCALAVACLSPLASFAGQEVGNGGGFAQCADRNLYSYDYLLTLNSLGFKEDYKAVKAEDYFARISSELKRLKDPLSVDFDLYIESLFQDTIGAKYQWLAKTNLHLMWEPELDQRLPVECRRRIQAVYYFAPFPGVPHATYKYDPDLIQQVANQNDGALQVSYLMVHEWLWNFFDRSDLMRLAAFNRLLHSEALSSMSLQDFYKHRPMGL